MWQGPRWLDFLEGQAGEPVVGAWLGHGDDDRQRHSGSWAFIGTFSRQHVTSGWLGPDETFEHHLVRRAAMIGVKDRPSLDRVLSAPDEWETWDAADLSLGEQTLSARTLEHAGVRVALSFDLPELGLIVHSRGFGSVDLSLAEVSDHRRYHFDPTEQLAYPTVLIDSVEAARGFPADTEAREGGGPGGHAPLGRIYPFRR